MLFRSISILKFENNFGQDTCESIIRFIELCRAKNKLNNWTIAIKTRGDANSSEGKGILMAVESGLPKDIDMIIRRGPKDELPTRIYRDNFIQNKEFTASGKSANIITSGLDFSILLSVSQIKEAENEFIENRRTFYQKKYPEWTSDQVNKKAEKVNFPERIYREKMSDQEGMLLIYILDSYYVLDRKSVV